MGTAASLSLYLQKMESEYGGDVGFIPPLNIEKIQKLEKKISWRLPDIYTHFYTQETNGLVVGQSRILSVFQADSKRTWVENIERYNDKKKNLYFQNREYIYDDYLIIAEGSGLFCLSKKYDSFDPEIYLCNDYNSKKGVNFFNTGMALEGLIQFFVEAAFS